MSDEGERRGRAAFTQKSAESFVAAAFFAVGGVVIYDSLRLGAKWAEDGPEAGYLPFYIGLVMCLASLVNLARALLVPAAKGRAFVEVDQLGLVLAVLVPTAVYVGVINWLGIYVASILFIGYFMRRLGHYAWWKLAAVAVGNSVFFFVVFEVWFKIPLPKGPLETLLGIA
jgi:putative tricarboxylic transport membrane protein